MTELNVDHIEPATGRENPRLIHRVYCTSFKPFYDPYLRYLDSWKREMPDYEIVHWNEETIDFASNEWLHRCFEGKSPVYISEYVRWWALKKFGGLYLDADCEILDGKVLDGIVSELYAQDDYDIVFGIEAKENGYPTAQTVAAKPNSELAQYMCDLYENRLPPLFHWRDSHALIGPRLMGLYMLEKGVNTHSDGFFVGLDKPVIVGGMKVYPQAYFSPKFSLLGETLDYQEGKTCIYHMFGNANIDFSQRKLHRQEKARQEVQTFAEYRDALERQSKFPRNYDASHFSYKVGTYSGEAIESTGEEGVLAFGPYVSLPKGRYSCHFNLEPGDLKAIQRLAVTSHSGTRVLAERKYDASRLQPDLKFNLDEDTAGIEFVVTCKQHPHRIRFKGSIVDVNDDENHSQDLLQLRKWRGYLRWISEKLGR